LKFVDVVLSSGQAPTFTYLDTSGSLGPGDLVQVPFGNRRIKALVWEAHGREPAFVTKSVDERLLEKPFAPVHLTDLCRWIAEYYLCPPGVAAGPLWSCAGKSTFVRLGLGKRASSKSKLRGQTPPPAPERRFELNAAQQAVASTLLAGLDTDGFQPFLLHGITGSGKTAVFLDAARHALDKGRQVLILVPEIGLTPQTVKRTAEALGERVATLHSQISDAERADAWTSLRDGNCRVALGPRSALFAPLFDPGLIVVDEEHDGSYKQNGDTPRYHGRDAAVWLARRCSIPAILGSATPSLESWHNARTGRYGLLELPERAAGALPQVEAVDLREGRKSTGSSISPRLRTAMAETLAKGERVMVLHNRRGWAPQAECLDCGAALECPDCPGLRLTWHRESGRLVCHHCGYSGPLPKSCPACGGRSLEPQGWAIQRVQEEMERLFPGRSVVRLDRDVASKKGGHGMAMDSFLSDGGILLGTQMIAKGHDIPDVTLVGVTDSDIGAGMPDFRAAERTFQLLCQVAGRAGRADLPGRAILQTRRPDDPLLRDVLAHDYGSFAARELETRRILSLPPFARMVLVEASSEDEASAERWIGKVASALRPAVAAFGGAAMGPLPAPVAVVARRHRRHLLCKSPPERAGDLRRAVLEALVAHQPPKDVRAFADVDPVDVM
jgi:primosomal protein N' (replication factor Y) (superfamily II helicase)